MKHLVSTDWLEKNLENVKILDGSWHLPSSNRNALDEFNSGPIIEVLIVNALLLETSPNSLLLP